MRGIYYPTLYIEREGAEVPLPKTAITLPCVISPVGSAYLLFDTKKFQLSHPKFYTWFDYRVTCFIGPALSAHEVTLSANFVLYRERRDIAVNSLLR